MQQDMVERLAAALRGMDEDAQILACRLLADELIEALGPQRRIGVLGRALGRRDAGGIGGHARHCERSEAIRLSLLPRLRARGGGGAAMASDPRSRLRG